MAKKKNKSKSSKTSLKDDCENTSSSTRTSKSPALFRLCRLCETKDGPYLNVFDSDKLISKKIDELLPFSVLEEDDLPNIICFRCSAKVEELYEFVQKCSKTQENLNKAMGRHTFVTKNKTRLHWDDKLNESNMSNDDICNAIAKKAMQALTDISTVEEKKEDENGSKTEKRLSLKREAKTYSRSNLIQDEDETAPLKQLKLDKLEEPNLKTEETPMSIKTYPPMRKSNSSLLQQEQMQETKSTSYKNLLSFDYDDSSSSSTVYKKEIDEKPKNDSQPFNIMDHVSTIKVNGVGILFQCKLCNRNFLKKEVVLVHGCAKGGKTEVRKTTPPPELPKSVPNTVKYINLKTDKDLKKPTEKPVILQETSLAEVKQKPKIGPASKVKKTEVEPNPSVGMIVQPRAPSPQVASVQLPTMPNVNNRYKLIPGPNKTFSLIEDSDATEIQEITNKPKIQQKPEDLKSLLKSRPGLVVRNEVINLDDVANDTEEIKILLGKPKKHKPGPKNPKARKSDVNQESKSATDSTSFPYPIGMFQSHQNINQPTPIETPPNQPTFTTPAMKKQSYTVVQTGNPSKLLISARPMSQSQEAPKPKTIPTKSNIHPPSEQPFKVTLEDATPKSSGFFTYVNIDPLLKPCHVIPSDDIIQESQISTSTTIDKEKSRSESSYSCNFCSETFSREKKLLSHIQAHYKQLDEEDEIRDKPLRRRK